MPARVLASANRFVTRLNPNMKPDLIKLSTLALMPAAWLILTGCSSTINTDKTTTTAFKEGVPGGTLTQTYQITATVTAMDPATRQVTLAAPDGSQNIFKAGPKVVLDQIKVGGEVKVTVARELVVYLNPDDVPATTSPAATVRATPGVRPGVLTADTVELTATVEAVDLPKHEATCTFPMAGAGHSRFDRTWIYADETRRESLHPHQDSGGHHGGKRFGGQWSVIGMLAVRNW